MQKKLKKGRLIDNSGHLIEAGYAKEHLKLYNRKQIKKTSLRIKEWDYHYINTQHFGLGITIADNGYVGLVSAAVMDFENAKVHQKMRIKLLSRGKMNLVCHPENGQTTFVKKDVNFNLSYNKKRTSIKLYWEKFKDDLPLEVDIKLDQKPKDSIVIAIPFSKPHQFYYNQKTIGMQVKGVVNYEGKNYALNKENALGLLDYGRGVWPYKSTWFWGVFQGKYKNTIIGLNIGGGFGNTSQASEDMFFIDGIGHKLSKGRFSLTKNEDGSYDYLKPWYYETEDNRLKVKFNPSLKRVFKTNLGIIKNAQHQIFGEYEGSVILDDGSKFTFEAIQGFAEYFINKW